MVDGILTAAVRSRTLTVIGAALALGVAGCAHVGEDEFEAEMAAVRAEMRSGDHALSERIDGVEQRMGALESELRALEDELDMQVERLESSLRVHTPVHFGFDSSRLEGESSDVLGRISAVLREHYPAALITVEGFTDPAGSAAYNLELGRQRAEAVRGWLVSDGGLGAGQVRAVSYGEQTDRLVRPGEAGPGQEGWQNRRVVLVIDHADAAPARAIVSEQGS